VAMLFLYLMRRRVASAIVGTSPDDTAYLSYNVPAYVPGERVPPTYGDLVIVHNPPGNCGGRVYYAAENLLASAMSSTQGIAS
jgi:hypothetical protein